MIDSVKKVAVSKLIEVMGEEFVKNNRDNFAISYSESEKKYVIDFLLSQPSNNVTYKAINNLETPIKNYMSVSIDKKTNKCVVLENTL